ncbi:MAG: F0F1 ATP synthase subunit alpha [bacterium]
MDNTLEIIKNLKQKINQINTGVEKKNVGTVVKVYDGIADVDGLSEVAYGEIVTITDSKGNNVRGLAMNLEEDKVGVIILDDYAYVSSGNQAETTGKILSLGVSNDFLGRVINPLGVIIDGGNEVKPDKFYQIEKVAPGVAMRKAIKQPLKTGILAVDSMFAIGRGQRELIIGDRGTGKTALAVDTIINQRDTDVYCIYVAIGQKASKVAQLKEILENNDAMSYTTIVSAAASDPATMQYIAPYAGVTLAEYLMDQGKDVLVIYDDLTKHAYAYRQISLLLKRPSGREAYPGDVFYLHSRLLERAARRDEAFGGGSITALPIIETQQGDVSAYIPTNVISITDGQIFLETGLFNAGQRPAINTGISVSRVGGDAQTKALKKVAGKLKLEMSQYQELAAFAQFGSDLDESTKAKLLRGSRVNEILKQPQYIPLSDTEQTIIVWAATNGYFDKIELKNVNSEKMKLVEKFKALYPETVDKLNETHELNDEILEKFQEIIKW